MTRYNCEFDYFYGGEKVAHVVIKHGIVTSEKYTEDWFVLPFGAVADDKIGKPRIDRFYEEHCIPEHRADLQEWLDVFGLKKYDAFEICKITHGELASSRARIEFCGESRYAFKETL